MIKYWCATAIAAAGVVAPFIGAAQTVRTDYKVESRIPGPDGGWDFANVDATTGRLYVARTNAVMAVDLKNRTVTTLASVRRAHQVLVLPGSAELVETDGETGLTRFIDTTTGAVLAEVATGKNPDAAFYDAATGLVVVMNADDGTVALVDAKTHALAGKIEVGGGLEFGVADGKGGAFIHIEDRNAIVFVDLRARRVVKTIALTGCESPTGLAVVGDGTRLISACANQVATVVDPTAGAVVATFPIGRDPDAVLVDETRHRAFIPCGGSGTLIALDIADPAKISLAGTIATQVGAKTGAIDPRDGRIYLPTATLGTPEPGAKRGKPAPGSFAVLVLAPSHS